MSVRIDASGDYICRTASLPSLTNFTACGWVRLKVSQAGSYRYIFTIAEDITTTDKQVQLGADSGNNWYLGTSTDVYDYFASSPSLDTWYFWFVKANADPDTWDAGIAAAGGTFDALQVPNTTLSFTTGSIVFSNDTWSSYLNSEASCIKVWDAILTEAELYQEMYSMLPRRFADLHLYWPLWGSGDTADYSGNAKDATVGGTLATADQPPIGYGVTESGLLVPSGYKPLYAQLDESVRDSNDYVYL